MKYQCPCWHLVCRVYERERKKIKAKAIDSNTTALEEGKAEEEVKMLFSQ